MVLYGKKQKKFINAVWVGIAIMVILSMILLYTPIFL